VRTRGEAVRLIQHPPGMFEVREGNRLDAPADKLFTGQRRYGGKSGIYYYGYRFYNADIGRFLQADSIVPGAGNPQALNRYSYVLDNPLIHTDPTGHCVPDVNCPRDECYRNPECGQAPGPPGPGGGHPAPPQVPAPEPSGGDVAGVAPSTGIPEEALIEQCFQGSLHCGDSVPFSNDAILEACSSYKYVCNGNLPGPEGGTRTCILNSRAEGVARTSERHYPSCTSGVIRGLKCANTALGVLDLVPTGPLDESINRLSFQVSQVTIVARVIDGECSVGDGIVLTAGNYGNYFLGAIPEVSAPFEVPFFLATSTYSC